MRRTADALKRQRVANGRLPIEPLHDRGDAEERQDGVKGVGEIGQVAVAAAIANAVFNATGRRIRELPLAAELVMDPAPVVA